MNIVYVKREEDNFVDFCTYTRASDNAYFEIPAVYENNEIDYLATETNLNAAIVEADKQIANLKLCNLY